MARRGRFAQGVTGSCTARGGRASRSDSARAAARGRLRAGERARRLRADAPAAIAALVPGWLGLSSLVFYAWLLLGRPGLPLLALLWEHDRGASPRPGLLAWAGLLLGCALWTKNEGLLLALAILAVRAARGRARPRPGRAGDRSLRRGPPAPRLMCGELNDLAAGQGAETLARLLDPTRWGTTAGSFVTRGARPYLTTPNDLVWQLDSSLQRLLLHVWPIVLLALGSAVAPTAPGTPDP